MDPALVSRDASLGAAPSDAVERARAGDRAAFEILVRSRVDRMHRTACAILGNEADAYDATQEAFLSAWQQLPRLRDANAFDAWLTRIIVNACRMRLRARRAVREVQAVEPDQTGVPPGATGYATGGRATDDLADGVAANERLGRAFERLTVDERTLLVLYHLHHYPVAEVARLVGRPEGTVKRRLSEARTALQRELEVEDRG